MKYSIDSIDEELAILENLETQELIPILVSDLPKNIKEGSILVLEDGKYRFEEEETKKRHDEIKSRFDRLKKKSE